jgi:muconolactone delta-isomerase
LSTLAWATQRGPELETRAPPLGRIRKASSAQFRVIRGKRRACSQFPIQESNMQCLVVVSRSEHASSISVHSEEIEAEAEFVRRLYASGVVRQIWLRAEGGACMISEAEDESALRQLLSELPLVKDGYLAQPLISQLRAYSATDFDDPRMTGRKRKTP